MKITVVNQGQKDIESTNFTVIFKDDTLEMKLSGHLNNLTNYAHITYEDYEEAILEAHKVDINILVFDIENRNSNITFV